MIRTKIWAHRGASIAAPENTLAAFEMAIRMGADGFELDVQRTADGVLVVAHDEECQRVTGQPGSIARMTLAELRKLNFADHFPGAGFQAIPTLADVFELVLPSNLTVNVELKNAVVLYPGMEEQVLRLIIDMNMQNRVQLSSFNHYSLVEMVRLLREKNLSIPCGPLYFCGIYEPWVYAARLGFAAIHPLYGNLQIPSLVDSCHAAGIAVNPWVIDDPAYIAMALKLGVDAIITKVPDQALLIRDKSI